MTRFIQRITSELLVLKARGGDRAALSALVELWSPVLLGRCRRLLRHDADAQDAAQTAWIKAMRGLHRLKDPACFAAWLLRIGHLSYIDIIRRRGRQTEIYEQWQQTVSEKCEPDRAEALDVRHAIARLPAAQQDILDLHYRDGFSMAEIGHILGISAGTVKSRLHSARKILRTKLETGEIQ
jgi:RNA polymerase sigma-70 factor (ECF subfamily)